MVSKSRKNRRSRSSRNSHISIRRSRVVARQTKHTQKRKPLLKGISSISRRSNRSLRMKGGRTLVTTGNKLTWGPVDQFGLLPEVNTRDYPNSYTPTWNSGSPYPSSL